MSELRALVLCCTLKPSPSESSSELIGREVLTALTDSGVATTELIRVVDHDVKHGVAMDMGGGDEWPAIRQKVIEADILVLATPIWMGQPSSVAKKVLERLDAELSETDDAGRYPTYGKVAAVAVVGNEDGAHHTSAELYQGLSDVGYTIPANGVTYWVGTAMEPTDYQDLDPKPQTTASTTEGARPERGAPGHPAAPRELPRPLLTRSLAPDSSGLRKEKPTRAGRSSRNPGETRLAGGQATSSTVFSQPSSRWSKVR